jgi:hypothetical protein
MAKQPGMTESVALHRSFVAQWLHVDENATGEKRSGADTGIGTLANIATGSAPDTLTALRVNASTGLSGADVDVRRKENGYNEVTERRERLCSDERRAKHETQRFV